MTTRPFDSRFGQLAWEQELGRPLDAADLRYLRLPGGESMMIQQRAADGYPALVIIADIPEMPPATLWTRMPPSALTNYSGERHYYVKVDDTGAYHIYGHWFFGHSQFSVSRGRWTPAGQPFEAGQHLDGLQMAILAAVIEQRASAMIAQREWLAAIADITDEGERLEELRLLLAEGRGIIEVTSVFGDSGTALLNFQGVAGLPVYEVHWHRFEGHVMVDGVERPPMPESALDFPRRQGRPRHVMDPTDPSQMVVIELCSLYMGQLSGAMV